VSAQRKHRDRHHFSFLRSVEKVSRVWLSTRNGRKLCSHSREAQLATKRVSPKLLEILMSSVAYFSIECNRLLEISIA
jgi:hypothetical protein